MEEFLTKLYSYENFSTYLIISIVILIILFIVILCLGKKDQKEREIEATKKLIQINEETMNDQFTMEDSNIEQNRLENDTIIVPNISDINVDNNVSLENNNKENISQPVIQNVESEPVIDIPLVDETPMENVIIENSFKEETAPEVVEVPKQEKVEYPEFNSIQNMVEPVLPSNDEKPFEFNDFNFSGEVISPVEPEVKGETPFKVENKQEEINVPEFDFDKIVRNVEEVASEEKKRSPEIFSSVYAPKKEDIKVEKVNNVNIEEDEFELPTLKKEVEGNKEEIDIPKLNDYNLDEIAGETYNIK